MIILHFRPIDSCVGAGVEKYRICVGFGSPRIIIYIFDLLIPVIYNIYTYISVIMYNYIYIKYRI